MRNPCLLLLLIVLSLTLSTIQAQTTKQVKEQPASFSHKLSKKVPVYETKIAKSIHQEALSKYEARISDIGRLHFSKLI